MKQLYIAMMTARTLWAAVLLCTATVHAATNQTCMDFDPTQLVSNSTLRLREYIHANTTIVLDGMDPSCNRTKQIIPVDACRVSLTVPTSNRSSFILELFLPDSDLWTGRYLATGNGGIDGCIKYEDIAYGLSHGFATSGTNNGHNGTGGADFLNNPDVIIDYSWRALHTAAINSKSLISAFYASAPNHSYYLGCSGGGRQGIQAASMFPTDYDGLLVGAPALNFNYMSAWRASFFTITGAANSSDFITAETWKGLIHTEVLRQCDTLDGVADGILADPALCLAIFRPEALLCNSTTSPATNSTTGADCLTSKQVSIVRQIFSPLYGPAGSLVYPPLTPGSEAQATDRLLSGSTFAYSVDWYRYAVYSDPSWDPASWSSKDIEASEEVNPGNVRTWPGKEMAGFRDSGGKFLVYHGGADQQISALGTERWYDYLSREMGATSEELDGFLRFFKIPGMGHCSGGKGAWMIGQNAAGAKGLGYEGERNVLRALVDWVEEGRQPETVVGTGVANGDGEEGKGMERVHCRYPFRVTYRGTGEDGEEEWECV